MSHPSQPMRSRPLTSFSSLVLAWALGKAVNALHGAGGDHSHREHVARTGPVAQSAEASAGSGAASPSDISSPGWWAILKRTLSEVSNDRVLAVAAGVTFYSLLALFPAVTVLVSLYGLFAAPESISEHLSMLGNVLPEGAMSIIGDQVRRIAGGDGAKLGLAAIFGLIVALWSANSGMKAIMDALNIVYDAEEKRSFLKLNAVSLVFTLSAILGLIVMFGVVAVVPVLLNWLWLGGTADVLISIGRWPLMLVLTLFALAVLYRYGPSRPEVRWRWITPGSVLASIGLLVFSMAFSWYAANFGKFNETYGSLGAAIGFMTWLWLSAAIILVGAELNSEIEHQARPGAKADETGAEKT